MKKVGWYIACVLVGAAVVFIFLPFIAFYLIQKSPGSPPQNTEPYPIIELMGNRSYLLQ